MHRQLVVLQLVFRQLVIKLYLSVDIWINLPWSHDPVTGSLNYTSAFSTGSHRGQRMQRGIVLNGIPFAAVGRQEAELGISWHRHSQSESTEPDRHWSGTFKDPPVS